MLASMEPHVPHGGLKHFHASFSWGLPPFTISTTQDALLNKIFNLIRIDFTEDNHVRPMYIYILIGLAFGMSLTNNIV